MKTYIYDGQTVMLKLDQYGNKRPALILIDAFDFLTVAKATINVVDDDDYKDGEVVIRNYEDNAGMLTFLLQNELVTIPHRWIKTGYVISPVCYLTKNVTEKDPLFFVN